MVCHEGQVLTVTTNIKRIFRFYYEWWWAQTSSQLIRITDRQILPVFLGPDSRNPPKSSKRYPKQNKRLLLGNIEWGIFFFSLSGLRKSALYTTKFIANRVTPPSLFFYNMQYLAKSCLRLNSFSWFLLLSFRSCNVFSLNCRHDLSTPLHSPYSSATWS